MTAGHIAASSQLTVWLSCSQNWSKGAGEGGTEHPCLVGLAQFPPGPQPRYLGGELIAGGGSSVLLQPQLAAVCCPCQGLWHGVGKRRPHHLVSPPAPAKISGGVGQACKMEGLPSSTPPHTHPSLLEWGGRKKGMAPPYLEGLGQLLARPKQGNLPPPPLPPLLHREETLLSVTALQGHMECG